MANPSRIFYGEPQPIISILEIKSYTKEVTKISVYGLAIFGILLFFGIMVALSEASKIPSLIISSFMGHDSSC